MYRVDLDVPFSDKDQVKRLGARWDSTWKVWYVPAGVDALQLKNWIATVEEGRVRSKHFYFLTTMVACWKCKQSTRVHGICLPPNHEKYEVVEQKGDTIFGTWVSQENACILSFVEAIADSVKTKVASLSSNYELTYSKQKKHWYLMNHCSHCGVKISDHGLHGEQGNPFFFSSVTEAMSIIIHRHDTPFSGHAIAGCWASLDDYIRALKSYLEKTSQNS